MVLLWVRTRAGPSNVLAKPRNMPPLFSMFDVCKRFGATQALAGVSLEVEPGEVHALIGENGAGKSTLMKILAGVYRADRGEMRLAGNPFAPSDPADALSAGVAMIHQELNLAPHLSVEANIMLGQERHRAGWVRRRTHARIAQDVLNRLSRGDVPLNQPVGRLPIAMQQLTEIARALASQARVLVFDEPTSSLTEQDAAHLFEVIRELRRSGMAIVYISHFLEELAQISDRYTVLRDGRVVANGRLEETSLDDIVRMMVGRDLTEMFPRVPHTPGEPLLEIRNLSGDPMPRNVTLTVRRGEIVGLAGLVGAGRTELLRTIFGLDRATGGKVTLSNGATLRGDPRQSIRQRLGFVSEDRKEEGLALSLSIADNLTLTRLTPYLRAGVLNLRRRNQAVRQWLQRINCKAAGPGQAVGELSGGNQQKVAIARLLHQQADLLLLDEPTRGIDVGTKAEIYRLIGQLAARGQAILMVSSYLPELMNVCDTIGVMCRGRLVEVRAADQWTEEEVMHRATGREAA